MHKTAVADTGPLLHLSQIGQEGQLTVFMRVGISRQVQEELARRVVFDQIAVVLGERLVVESVTSTEMNAQRTTLTSFKLHQTDVSIEYDMARWYRGAVQSITDLQPMPCCSTLLVTHRPDN